jgi:hypothetical protein
MKRMTIELDLKLRHELYDSIINHKGILKKMIFNVIR